MSDSEGRQVRGRSCLGAAGRQTPRYLFVNGCSSMPEMAHRAVRVSGPLGRRPAVAWELVWIRDAHSYIHSLGKDCPGRMGVVRALVGQGKLASRPRLRKALCIGFPASSRELLSISSFGIVGSSAGRALQWSLAES